MRYIRLSTDIVFVYRNISDNKRIKRGAQTPTPVVPRPYGLVFVLSHSMTCGDYAQVIVF